MLLSKPVSSGAKVRAEEALQCIDSTGAYEDAGDAVSETSDNGHSLGAEAGGITCQTKSLQDTGSYMYCALNIWSHAQAAAAGKGKGKAAAADKISQLRMMLLEELGLRHDDVQLTAAAPLPDQLITIAQVCTLAQPTIKT